MHKEKKADMNNEMWLEKIKARLSEHSEPLPASGWERLEHELPSRPKLIPFYRKLAVAAAILIGALSFVGLHLMNRPSDNSVPEQKVASAIHIYRHSKPEETNGENLPAAAHPRKRELAGLTPAPDAKYILKRSDLPNSIRREVQQATKRPETAQPSAPKETELPGVENPLLASADTRHTRRKGWALALSVGNAAGKMNDNSILSNALNALSPGTGYLDMDLSAASNGVVAIPNDQDVVFQNGLPYLQRSKRQVMSIDHKQPISVGFSVRKELSKGFSLETGLTYSYLASEIWYEGETEAINQKLHYLGIPLRANWSFFDRKNVVLYLSAGGTIEKCIYGKVGSETTIVDPVQLSTMAAVGIQYNFSRHTGIYIEPGWAYYFDDGSDIQTIRKEQPSRFTLQAGFRLSY